MIETITLDTRKCDSPVGKPRISPLRRGERNNLLLTVKICEDRKPYDLTGKTASLVATTAAGASVGPYRLEIADEAAGVARILLPSSLYSAIGTFTGYVEIREGESMVDTTDSFGGCVIDCIAPSSGEQVGAYANLGDYRSGEQASWTYPTQEGMAFAGWYKDAAFTTPCTANDVEGPAYAKFVKVGDLFYFIGCSIYQSENAKAENVNVKFTYIMSVPESTVLIEFGIYYKLSVNATKPEVRRTINGRDVCTGNKIATSWTFLNTPPKHYKDRLSTKAFVKYTTEDGTTVEAVQADYNTFSTMEVADAILAHPMATQADKDYAAAIKAAIQKE